MIGVGIYRLVNVIDKLGNHNFSSSNLFYFCFVLHNKYKYNL